MQTAAMSFLRHWPFDLERTSSESMLLLSQFNRFPQSLRLLLELQPGREIHVQWLIGRFVAFRPKGHRFESRSSRQVGILGKSFTHSCLWRCFSVKLRHSICLTVLCRERL